MDLLSIKPHVVSRDLSGYITYVYGAPKVGKTSLASQTEGALLLAFEPGYRAIPGIIAQDITSWSEFRQALKELKKPEVKATFKTVIVDTVDLAVQFCEKYICSQQGVESIGDLGYGKGFKMVQKELEESFRSIAQMGYALFFIAHSQDKTFNREDGTSYNQTVPTVSPSYNRVIAGMSDVYAYAHQVRSDDGVWNVMLTLRSPDNSAETGCRFKYIVSEIPFTYDDLNKAVNDAIDKIAEVNGKESVTDKREVAKTAVGPDFDELMMKFQDMVHKLQDVAKDEFATKWAPRIVEITNRHLGKGKKVSDCTREQVEQLDCIVNDLEAQIGEGI